MKENIKHVKVFMDFEEFEMVSQKSIPMKTLVEYEIDKLARGETLAGYELIKRCVVDSEQFKLIEEMDSNEFSEFLNLWMEASNA